jgi:hypothetical protein
VSASVTNDEGEELGVKLPQGRPFLKIFIRLDGAVQNVDLEV